MSMEGAIFNFEDTLLETLRAWDALWNRFSFLFYHNISFAPCASDEKAVRLLPLKDAMQLIHERYKIGFDADDLVEEAKDVFEKFYKNSLRTRPGVYEYLQGCSERGVKMCVISMTEKSLVKKALKMYDMDKFFDKIFSCEDLNLRRHDKDVYRMAHNFLGTPLENTWVFEGNLTSAATAKSMGFRTVGIHSYFYFHHRTLEGLCDEFVEADKSINDLIIF